MNWINSKNPCLIPKSFLYQLHTHIYIYSQKIYLLLQLHWIVVLHGNNIKKSPSLHLITIPVQHNGKSSREYILARMILLLEPFDPEWNFIRDTWFPQLESGIVNPDLSLRLHFRGGRARLSKQYETSRPFQETDDVMERATRMLNVALYRLRGRRCVAMATPIHP